MNRGCLVSLLGFALFGAVAMTAVSPANAQAPSLDTAAIERALGAAGQMTGGVYKIGLPRTDLHVTVDGVTVLPGLALGSWIAFEATSAADAAADGDLVLKETEVNPVLRALRQNGIEVTAVHNHLLLESPRVIYVHFFGRGPAAQVAAALKKAIALTATPFPAPGSGSTPQPERPAFDADRVMQILALKGTLKNGVLSVTRPRPETITMMGVKLPPAMGMATSMNFQAAEAGKVAATGDFVLTGDEVNRVMSALAEHGILVTALHNHMIHGSPELYFMHFWAHDSAERVATGLKAALDAFPGQ